MRVLIVALMTYAAPAAAQDGAPGSPSPDVEAARSHFEAGQGFYADARWNEAIEEFSRALDLVSDPPARAALVYNVAQCHRNAGRRREAIAQYRRYLEMDPAGRYRGEAEAQIRALEEAEAQEAARAHAPEQTSEPAVATRRQEPTLTPLVDREHGLLLGRTYTWIAGGAGAVLAIGAGVTWLLTRSEYDDYLNGCGTTAAGCMPDEIDSVNNGVLITNVLLAGAGAAAVAGVVLFFLEGHRTEVARGRFRIGIAPAGALVSGSW